MKRVLVVGLSILPALASAQVEEQTPNVLLILIDDVGIGDLSCYGAELISTPTIDRFAAENVQFMNAYTSCSVSSPTRFSVLTGCYPFRNSYSYTAEGFSPVELALNPESGSIAKMFQDRGYATAAIGKWHLGYGNQNPIDFEQPLDPGPMELGFDYHFGLYGNHNDRLRTYVENHELVNRIPGVAFEPQTSKSPVVGIYPERKDDEVNLTMANKVKQFIRENRNDPFFIYYTPSIAHTHVTPQERYRGVSDAGLYGDYLYELDQIFGELLTLLDELGIADNTIVAMCSDNGGQENDVKGAGNGILLASNEGDVMRRVQTAKRDAREMGHKTSGEYRGYKGSFYEGGFRVPFMVRWGDQSAKGVKSYAMVSTADFFATCAAAIGAEIPSGLALDSHNFMPAVMEGADPNDVYQIRENNLLLTPGYVLSYREGDWKLIDKSIAVGAKQGENEIYNLAEDPYETNNLIRKESKRVKRMQAEIEKYKSSYFRE